MSVGGQDSVAEPAHQIEPVRVRVDQHQLVDRENIAQSGHAVHELGGVRRTSPDDNDFQPLTPVNATPSMKAF